MVDDAPGTAQPDLIANAAAAASEATPEATAPPVVRPALTKAEELSTRRVKLLVQCGSIAALAATALNVGLAIWTSAAATSGVFVITTATWLGWGWLQKRVPVRAIAHATLGACVVAVALIALGEGTTRTPNLHFMSLIVVASALLLGVRASRFWTGASIFAAAAAFTADAVVRGAAPLVCFNHALGLTIILVVLHLLASAAWRVADSSMAESESAAERARSAAIELEAANEALSTAMQARSRFLANMSHEIRTPLNAVLGFTDVLLGTTLDSDQHQYAETIRGAGQGLLVVVDDVLDLARIEAGKLTFAREEIDLEETVGASLDMLGVAAHKKGLELWAEIAEDAPSHLDGDPARVRQVLLNLLGNAVKFTANGEVVVTLRGVDGGATARIEVADTGIGIPRSAYDDLFQPFGQVDGSTRRRYDGTGLGLVISKKLVEGMGGRIGFTSEPGKGSCFWIELPGARISPPPARAPAQVSVLLVSGRAAHSRHLAGLLEKLVDGKVSVLPPSVSATELLAAVAGAVKALAIIDWDPAGPSPAALVAALTDGRGALRNVLLLAPLSEKVDAHGRRWSSQLPVLHKPVRPARLVQRLGTFESGERPPQSQPPPANRFQHRVLLVEDNVINQKIGRLLLQSTGCTVTVASNGVHAVTALATEEFDLVLMDLHMPELDGFEATRAIRLEERAKSRRRVPIVALSASVLPEDQERCLEVGMNGHLAKPISRKDLEDLLRKTPVKG